MAYLFNTTTSSSPSPKMHITTGTLPPYTNPSQPPTKKSPWRQIRSTAFIQSVRMALPSSLHASISHKLDSPLNTPIQYHKVILKLEDILTGSFFTEYIKTPGSNVLMLSEGRPGVDNQFLIQNGVLKMDLGKEDYQKAGLQGTVVKNSGGRKHVKERWRVELDLRAPSMVRGKKGFDRLLYACRNVLDRSLVWLFRDLKMESTIDSEEVSKTTTTTAAMAQHHPSVVNMVPVMQDVRDVLVPDMISGSRDSSLSPPPPEQLDDYYETIEWLDLVGLDSPRIRKDDNPDPYLSRYSVPDSDVEDKKPSDLKVLTWSGLIDHEWLIRLLVAIIKQSRIIGSEEWVALTVTAHRTEAVGQINGYTLLLHPGAIDDDNVSAEDAIDVDGPSEEMISSELNTASVTRETSKHGLQKFTCFQFVDA